VRRGACELCDLMFLAEVMVVSINRLLLLHVVCCRGFFQELPQSLRSLFSLLLPVHNPPRLFALPQGEFAQTQHGDVFDQIFLDKASTRDFVGAIVGVLVDLIAVVEGRGIGLELVMSLSSFSRAFGAHDKAQGRFLEEFPCALVRLEDGNHRVGHGQRVVLEVAEHLDSSKLLHQSKDFTTLGQRLYTRMQPQVNRAVSDWPDEPRECHVWLPH
jgi:hypothetical protein